MILLYVPKSSKIRMFLSSGSRDSISLFLFLFSCSLEILFLNEGFWNCFMGKGLGEDKGEYPALLCSFLLLFFSFSSSSPLLFLLLLLLHLLSSFLSFFLFFSSSFSFSAIFSKAKMPYLGVACPESYQYSCLHFCFSFRCTAECIQYSPPVSAEVLSILS